MSDENPLLDFLLADLAWGKKPRNHPGIPDSSTAICHPAVDDSGETADEAFAREIELAREVCEDAEVDALTQPVPTVTLPFGGDGGPRE